jgi:hypothetical protein
LAATVRNQAPAPAAAAPTISDLLEHESHLAKIPIKRPPSQKELATVFGITTRHLRRWEQAEQEIGHTCGRPYSAVDLWRLYQRRYPKKWDRAEGARLQLAALLDRFDAILGRNATSVEGDDHTALTILMLKSLAWEGDIVPAGTLALPLPMRTNLVRAAKEQLRSILACVPAREVLSRAYFEAVLLTDSNPPTQASGLSLARSA